MSEEYIDVEAVLARNSAVFNSAMLSLTSPTEYQFEGSTIGVSARKTRIPFSSVIIVRLLGIKDPNGMTCTVTYTNTSGTLTTVQLKFREKKKGAEISDIDKTKRLTVRFP